MARRKLLVTCLCAAFATTGLSCDSDHGGNGGSGGVCVPDAPPGDASTFPGMLLPADTSAPGADGSKPTTFAVRRVFLGDADWNGNTDPEAWQLYGLNIDGLTSDACSIAHCRQHAGAAKWKIKSDGPEGVDNSFGKYMSPLLNLFISTTQQAEAIAAGEFSLLIHLKNLGQQPSANGISAAVYGGAARADAPSWDGSDVWPVAFASVVAGDASAPVVVFPMSYVVGGVWVSGPSDDVVMDIPLASPSAFPSARIHRPVIEMTISTPSVGAATARGIISGVLDPEELISDVALVKGEYSQFCESSTFDAFAAAVRDGSDIMLDGTNGDPSIDCDGISVGLGFEAVIAELGTVGPEEQPEEFPCP